MSIDKDFGSAIKGHFYAKFLFTPLYWKSFVRRKTILFKFIKYIMPLISKALNLSCVYKDLSKALDKICHGVLHVKMSLITFSIVFLKWNLLYICQEAHAHLLFAIDRVFLRVEYLDHHYSTYMWAMILYLKCRNTLLKTWRCFTLESHFVSVNITIYQLMFLNAPYSLSLENANTLTLYFI